MNCKPMHRFHRRKAILKKPKPKYPPIEVGQHIRIRDDAEEGVFYDTGIVLSIHIEVRWDDDTSGSEWVRGTTEMLALRGFNALGVPYEVPYEVIHQ